MLDTLINNPNFLRGLIGGLMIGVAAAIMLLGICLLYTSPSPRD